MPLGDDSIELDSSTAAIVIKSDDSIELYLPKGKNDNIPSHALAIAALGSYWIEHREEILRWFSEQPRH